MKVLGINLIVALLGFGLWVLVILSVMVKRYQRHGIKHLLTRK
jgi:hypothetical protein